MPAFPFPTTAYSKPIWGNGSNVTAVTPIITGSGTDIRLDIGTASVSNGTYTWQEDVNIGISNTLSSPNKWIKWRMVGIDYTISKFTIQIIGGG